MSDVLTLLRSLWDEAPASDPPPPMRSDWALVGAAMVAAGFEALVRPGVALSAVVVIVLAPALGWRRVQPLAVVAVAFLGSATVVLATGGQTPPVASAVFLTLPYALYRWASGRDAVVGTAVIVANISVSTVVTNGTVADAVGSAAVVAAAMALGTATRSWTRARARELDQARLRERARIARDLHDTVAHHVSAIAIRAQAGLAASEARPDVATDALRVIEGEASRTLDEMRAMIGVLRTDDATALAPVPTIADLAGLARDGHDGPVVDVIAEAPSDLPQPVSTAIYRMAQEAVTNAVRHARGARRVEVRVTADDTCVRLRVSDDGAPVSARQRSATGYGIAGMVERAALLGGSCAAGPASDGGWTVTAALPRHGTAT